MNGKSTFLKVFGRSKVFLPVIHIKDIEQTHRNVELCLRAGADGVFLIGHNVPAHIVHNCLLLTRRSSPDFWIGVNFLDLSTRNANLVFPKEASGLWVDDANILEHYEDPLIHAREYVSIREGSQNSSSLYFGGVAFKYQTPVINLARVSKLATEVIDVVTTSGKATGYAPAIDKIKKMRDALEDHPLAIASGIDKSNVSTFLPYVDAFLVATGISVTGDFHELDETKTREVCEIVHAH